MLRGDEGVELLEGDVDRAREAGGGRLSGRDGGAPFARGLLAARGDDGASARRRRGGRRDRAARKVPLDDF